MSTEYGGRGNRQGSISARELRGDTRSRKPSAWGGIAFLAVMLLVIIGIGVVVLGPVYRDFAYNLAKTNPQAIRLPLAADTIKERLGSALTEPSGTDNDPIKFVVNSGESIVQIGQDLTAAGFISDPLVFAYHVVTKGLDDELQVGDFNLSAAMSPLQIAQRLALPPDPKKPKIVLGFRQALRLEQYAAYLQAQKAKGLEMEVQEFLGILQDPPQSLREEFPALKEIPKGRSLEGFMGRGTFEVDTDITPMQLVKVLLTEWQDDIGSAGVIEQAKKQGKDFYDVVTIASLVERETGEDKERDRIAGVYLNRLDPSLNPTGIMNADPTVIYAVDTLDLREKKLSDWTKFVFWTTVDKSLSKVKVPDDLASYQTYINPGAPDGPIATPTLASIEAVLKPDTKAGNLFFYACPGSTTHKFAKTLDEQQRNIGSCKPVKTKKP